MFAFRHHAARLDAAAAIGFALVTGSMFVLGLFTPASASSVRAMPSGGTAHQHLYVTNNTGTDCGVYRYPLDANGLPATQPDSFLHGGLIDAFQVTLDRQGYLYVSTSSAKQVNVYAPGASGNDPPVRTVPVNGPEFVSVDDTGYLYVTGGNENTVYVFKPGAGKHDSPINTIVLQQNNLFLGVANDRSGALYVAAFGGIYYYKHPITEHTPDEIFSAYPGTEHPVAFDRDLNRIYFRLLPTTRRGWSGSEYAATGPGFAPLPENPWRLFSDVCYSPRGSYQDGLAVNKNYLMLGCGSDRTIYVLPNHHGRQGKPVETITLPGGQFPESLALGL